MLKKKLANSSQCFSYLETPSKFEKDMLADLLLLVSIVSCKPTGYIHPRNDLVRPIWRVTMHMLLQSPCFAGQICASKLSCVGQMYALERTAGLRHQIF